MFKKLIDAVWTNDWETVAAEALASDWATQVGARAIGDATLLRTGVWPTGDV